MVHESFLKKCLCVHREKKRSLDSVAELQSCCALCHNVLKDPVSTICQHCGIRTGLIPEMQGHSVGALDASRTGGYEQMQKAETAKGAVQDLSTHLSSGPHSKGPFLLYVKDRDGRSLSYVFCSHSVRNQTRFLRANGYRRDGRNRVIRLRAV